MKKPKNQINQKVKTARSERLKEPKVMDEQKEIKN